HQQCSERTGQPCSQPDQRPQGGGEWSEPVSGDAGQKADYEKRNRNGDEEKQPAHHLVADVPAHPALFVFGHCMCSPERELRRGGWPAPPGCVNYELAGTMSVPWLSAPRSGLLEQSGSVLPAVQLSWNVRHESRPWSVSDRPICLFRKYARTWYRPILQAS